MAWPVRKKIKPLEVVCFRQDQIGELGGLVQIGAEAYDKGNLLEHFCRGFRIDVVHHQVPAANDQHLRLVR